ncbi:MAG TPA: amidohydrolase family protein [Gracilimonas sp.]|uniref:amidohydrolase n=1 Tax=Gracilimonas sp. TaxID=1974203 RepID=UPI002D97522D|nr:amidohydrolase family protein [Gracilimonas sp.]
MKKILITLFAFAVTISACTNDTDQKTFINANGYTFSGDSLISFETMIIENGKIVQVGGSELFDESTEAEVIDLEGKTVLPGLIDAHGHVMGLGYQELNVNLAGIETLEATLDTIKAYAEANPELEWIQGRGWNQTLWPENEFPTAADLDKVVDDRPVWLTRVDGHAAWANTKAMELAGISKETPDPQGGKIIRDRAGNATGVFVDAAENYIQQIVPEPTEVEMELALEKALEQMARMGLTSVHDAGIGVDTWNLYKEFADAGKMTTRIYAMIGGTGNAFDELSENGPIDSYANDRLALRSVKISSDGALGSRGAAMKEPYSDDPGNRGLLFYDQEELNEMVMKSVGEGYQTNIHAIGDRANDVVLNAFEKAKEEYGDQGLRHRIEHAQIVSLEDIPRFAELDLIASMQATHATSDMNMAVDRVGPDRIKGGYAWQKFLDQGTIIANGSDFPVEHSNPFYGLYSSVTRQDHEGNPPGGWYPEEALSRKEALKSFTINAAYAAHQEDILGTLEEGKWADFIVIDRDLFEVPAIEIWQTNVLQTWVAGEKVYEE